VAPGLFAVRFFYNHSFIGIYRAIRFAAAILLKKYGTVCFAAFTLVCLADKVRAVPICENNFGCAWYDIESSRAGRDLYGYNLVGLPYPGRAYGNFNEGDNIEWIYYALESQYAFLDDTLYRITGGSYLLGPVCYPRWHGFRYYYWVRDPGREIICAAGETTCAAAAYTDNAESGDIASLTALHDGTLQGHSLASLRKIPGWTYPGGGQNVDTKAIPELSTITLFGLAALQILGYRRIDRN